MVFILFFPVKKYLLMSEEKEKKCRNYFKQLYEDPLLSIIKHPSRSTGFSSDACLHSDVFTKKICLPLLSVICDLVIKLDGKNALSSTVKSFLRATDILYFKEHPG